jgi:hypothetical protein
MPEKLFEIKKLLITAIAVSSIFAFAPAKLIAVNRAPNAYRIKYCSFRKGSNLIQSEICLGGVIVSFFGRLKLELWQRLSHLCSIIIEYDIKRNALIWN